MKIVDIREVIAEELGNIAPEVDLSTIGPDQDIREACDIDSMDFLNLVAALHRRLGIDIPEIDYPKLFTLTKAIDYLSQRAVAAR
jgi:acyl carrier protein